MDTCDLYSFFITIPGIPIPWAASLVRERKSRLDALPVYDKRYNYKRKARLIVKNQYNGPLLTCPIALDFLFLMPIPASAPLWRKRKMSSGEIFHKCKPDTTNLVKLYEDLLKDIVIYDDALVVKLGARKSYHEKPCTVIRVTPLYEAAGKRE